MYQPSLVRLVLDLEYMFQTWRLIMGSWWMLVVSPKSSSNPETETLPKVNAHRGIEQSRRDDIEAIGSFGCEKAIRDFEAQKKSSPKTRGYVLIYFSRGQLPWQGFQAATKEEK